jgi:hypothetical protein
MRRLALPVLLLLCVLAAPGCKRKKRRPPLTTSSAQGTGSLASMIEVADPRTSLQLTKGWYAVESGSWRWTARSFAATLRPPKDSNRNGATLVVKISIPAVLIQKLGSLHLSALVNGLAVPVQEYPTAGDYTYSRDIPASVLQGDAAQVDFTLDKALSATPTDERELGLIVRAIGFEAKG